MTCRFLLALGLTASLISCGHSDPRLTSSAQNHQVAIKDGLLILKTGAQSVEVADLKAAVMETKAIAHAYKGYVESSSIEQDEEADFQLRVPAHHLEGTLDALSKIGKETSRHISTEDMTVESSDLGAELKNLRALRDRLRLLLQEATTVEETLKVERELTRVQSQLDALAAKLELLRNRIAYTRISLNLERRRTPGPLGIATKAIGLGVRKLFVLD